MFEKSSFVVHEQYILDSFFLWQYEKAGSRPYTHSDRLRFKQNSSNFKAK